MNVALPVVICLRLQDQAICWNLDILCKFQNVAHFYILREDCFLFQFSIDYIDPSGWLMVYFLVITISLEVCCELKHHTKKHYPECWEERCEV